MKKIMSLMLVLCLLSTLFAGCFVVSEDKPLTTDKTEKSSQDDDVDSEGTNNASEDENNAGEYENNAGNEIWEEVIEESVIYDDGGIRITVKGIEDDMFYGKSVKFLVENETEHNIAFTGDYFVLNGVTVYGWLYIEAAAGKKANGTMYFLDDLESMGITNIATLTSFDAHVYDTDTYDTICSTPFNISSSIADTYVQTIDDSGDVIFEQDGITVIAKCLSESVMGEYVQLLIKNETDQDINVEAENVSVNGYTIDAWMYETIYSNTVSYCGIDLYESSLQENDIDSVEEVTFTMTFCESEWHELIAESGELKVIVGE